MTMIDLSAQMGLDIQIGDDGMLILGESVQVRESKVRPFNALTPVAAFPDSCLDNQGVAYYIENDVCSVADADLVASLPMQYELTLIPGLKMGNEYVKTFGHRHIVEPKSGLDYTEVCRIEYGTAHFVLQDLDPEGPTSSVAFLIEAHAGDTVLLPPGWDHLTINPGPGPMLFSDVIARGVAGIYDRFRSTRGACLYEMDCDGEAVFESNPGYRQVPELQRIALQDYSELKLDRQTPLYQAFVETRGELWPFLLDPTLFDDAFPALQAQFARS